MARWSAGLGAGCCGTEGGGGGEVSAQGGALWERGTRGETPGSLRRPRQSERPARKGDRIAETPGQPLKGASGATAGAQRGGADSGAPKPEGKSLHVWSAGESSQKPAAWGRAEEVLTQRLRRFHSEKLKRKPWKHQPVSISSSQ